MLAIQRFFFRSLRNSLSRSVSVFLLVAAVHAAPALATVSAPVTVGGSLFSYGGSVALVGAGGTATGYGISKPSGWSFAGGVLALAGGFVIGFADPSPATFYAGSTTFHYDPNLLSVHEVGWLGDWGEDPSLTAPPVDSSLWDGVTVFLQSPATGLSVDINNDPVDGILDVDFDWGASGKAATSVEPFNMLGISFNVLEDSLITYVGDFSSPPPESNLYLSSANGISCTFPEEPGMVLTCGESTTSYFRISAVPEPSTAFLMLISAGALVVAKRRFRKRG